MPSHNNVSSPVDLPYVTTSRPCSATLRRRARTGGACRPPPASVFVARELPCSETAVR